MAKKIDAYIKLQVPAGQANPSPPVGPALGQHGLNIMEFCKAFNADTQGIELYLYSKDASRVLSSEKGGWAGEGQRNTS
jgi:hypothetical protein